MRNQKLLIFVIHRTKVLCKFFKVILSISENTQIWHEPIFMIKHCKKVYICARARRNFYTWARAFSNLKTLPVLSLESARCWKNAGITKRAQIWAGVTSLFWNKSTCFEQTLNYLNLHYWINNTELPSWIYVPEFYWTFTTVYSLHNLITVHLNSNAYPLQFITFLSTMSFSHDPLFNPHKYWHQRLILNELIVQQETKGQPLMMSILRRQVRRGNFWLGQIKRRSYKHLQRQASDHHSIRKIVARKSIRNFITEVMYLTCEESFLFKCCIGLLSIFANLIFNIFVLHPKKFGQFESWILLDLRHNLAATMFW